MADEITETRNAQANNTFQSLINNIILVSFVMKNKI